MPELPAPVLIEPERPAGKRRPYANLYRFGGDGPRPRVMYLGGAINRTVYEERRKTPPTAVATAFASARERVGLKSVDLVCCPCPLDTDGLGLEWILDHADEISEVAGDPTALVAVGYSAGAAYATTLALLDERARAVGFFGAADVPGTLGQLRPFLEKWARDGRAPLPAAYFVNTGDPVCAGDTAWMRPYADAISFRVERGLGSHPFVDYDRNAFVSGAFAFVLSHL